MSLRPHDQLHPRTSGSRDCLPCRLCNTWKHCLATRDGSFQGTAHLAPAVVQVVAHKHVVALVLPQLRRCADGDGAQQAGRLVVVRRLRQVHVPRAVVRLRTQHRTRTICSHPPAERLACPAHGWARCLFWPMLGNPIRPMRPPTISASAALSSKPRLHNPVCTALATDALSAAGSMRATSWNQALSAGSPQAAGGWRSGGRRVDDLASLGGLLRAAVPAAPVPHLPAGELPPQRLDAHQAQLARQEALSRSHRITWWRRHPPCRAVLAQPVALRARMSRSACSEW